MLHPNRHEIKSPEKMKKPITLTAGQAYDRSSLILIGFKSVEKNSNRDLTEHSFWSLDGTYRGPNQDSVEPIYNSTASDPAAVEAGIRSLDLMSSTYALSESRAKMESELLRRR